MQNEEQKTPAQVRKEVMDAVELLKASFEAHVEGVVIRAKLLRSAYDALIAEGFDQTQAMTLVCHRGPFL